MSSTRSLTIGVVVAGLLLGVFFVLRKPHSATEASPAATASTPRVAEAASADPWHGNPVSYDCSAFAPSSATAPLAASGKSAASFLLEKSRLYGASGVPCAAGVPVTRKDYAELEAALNAPVPASPFARAVLQNAAIAVARCAHASGKDADAPTAPELKALEAHARKFVQRFALDPAALTSLESASASPLAAWIGADAEVAGRGAKSSSTTNFHTRGSAFTMSTRPLGSVHGADAFYGDMVVIDTAGQAHVLSLPSKLVFRKTEADRMTICFAALGDPFLYAAPTLVAAAFPAGPFEAPGIRCDRCHSRGKALSIRTDARADMDRTVTNEVSTWYHGAR